MRAQVTILFMIVFAGCNPGDKQVAQMQMKIDSLQKKLAETYKPGFGEFMSGIQIHHAKLWFAGLNQNWHLADFEIHEIQEALEAVQKFCSDREETKSIGMISSPIDSLTTAIQQKDLTRFKSSYVLLTKTCNNCHVETKHEFNVVTIPTSMPVVNQDFRLSHQ
jgi:hypothetical protein